MKTDKQLKQDVQDELESDPAIDATRIGVEVVNRIVTLSGHPPSYAEKLAIERAANRVAGVKALVVDMTVHLPDDDVRTDEDIANAVRSVLHWTVGLHDDAVKVQVEHGWITLSGRVEWAYQSHLAVRAISQMRSVTGVTDHIAVQGRSARPTSAATSSARSCAMRSARRSTSRSRCATARCGCPARSARSPSARPCAGGMVGARRARRRRRPRRVTPASGDRMRNPRGRESQMTLSGEVHDADWSVAVETIATGTGGYRCRIHVTLVSPDGACERTFAHSRTHDTEREAAIDGLRAGMTWVEMRKSNMFTV